MEGDGLGPFKMQPDLYEADARRRSRNQWLAILLIVALLVAAMVYVAYFDPANGG